ncbi:carboxypeptidase S [Trametopsis cervina]|nr:carboxypeptidase S [Trametopsis cervina]
MVLSRLIALTALGFGQVGHAAQALFEAPIPFTGTGTSPAQIAFDAYSPSTCKQSPALFPKHSELDASLEKLFNNRTFQLNAYEALGSIVRVPSVSTDDLLPVGQDPRWEVFLDVHAVLESKFPLVFKSLDLTKVNMHNIVLHWQGSNTTLKPILMTAHQDVVPVEPLTVDQWVHPPFSGHYDGTYIWGRGSCDDKPDIISQLTTVDSLIRHGFKPTRTVVFAFGIDEESSGKEGAGKIARFLEAKYGKDAFASLLDEGSGFGARHGGDLIIASPDTGEKGYVDIHIEVNTPGGHSSVPPRHTAIGILASAIVAIEADPHPVVLPRAGTAFQQITCEATFDPSVPSEIRELVERAAHDDDALEELSRVLAAQNPLYEVLMATTQAVDIVQGGVKINALPERAVAIVNHRIAQQSSVSEVMERITSVILPTARKFNITLNAFGKSVYHGASGAGEINLADTWGTALEPAPMTPTVDAKPYEILMGTIKAALKASPKYNKNEVVISPGLAFGMSVTNICSRYTDTQSYWNLTKHIFRYGHTDGSGIYDGIHTVNEALNGESLIEKIRFHTKWILNWDEAED